MLKRWRTLLQKNFGLQTDAAQPIAGFCSTQTQECNGLQIAPILSIPRAAGRPGCSQQGRIRLVIRMLPGADASEDFLVRTSRIVFLSGLFLSSMLTLRIGRSLTLGDILIGASASLLVLAISKPSVDHPNRIAAVAGGICIIVGGCLSTAVSDSPPDSLLVLIRVLYVALVLPWQTLKLLNTPPRLEQGLYAISLGAALCASATVVQAAGIGTLGGSITSAGRFSGLTPHVSDAGAISALAVVLGLSNYRKYAGKWHHLIMAGVAMSGIIGLALSGSVSGMLAASVGLLLLLTLHRISPIQVLLFSIAILAAWLIATTIMGNQEYALSPLERFYQVTGIRSGPGENTMAQRFATDALGWKGFVEHPLTGVGLDPDAGIVMLGSLGVHNFWLAALHQGGVFFGLGLIIIIVPSLAAGWRARSFSRVVGSTFAVGLSAAAFAFTAPSFFNRYFWLPIALLTAALAVMTNEKENTSRGRPAVSSGQRELTRI
jgi:hypothetical protein